MEEEVVFFNMRCGFKHQKITTSILCKVERSIKFIKNMKRCIINFKYYLTGER